MGGILHLDFANNHIISLKVRKRSLQYSYPILGVQTILIEMQSLKNYACMQTIQSDWLHQSDWS